MKYVFIIFLFISNSLLADGPVGKNPKGHYGSESMFTEKGQDPMPPKGYDKKLCFKATKTFRAQINRLRTVSFRIDRKCEKGAGGSTAKACLEDIAYGKMILGLLSRQYEVITNVCSDK